MPHTARADAVGTGPAAVEPLAVGTHLRLTAISIVGQLRDSAGIVLVTGPASAQAALAASLAELIEQETAGELVRVAGPAGAEPAELLRQCCAALGLPAGRDAATMQRLLADRIAADRRRGADVVLWIDGADTLSARDWRALQTEGALRLPTVLAAGADFDERLDAPELAELKQALRARYRLPSLEAAQPAREPRLHKAASAREANDLLLSILQEAGSRAKADGLLRFPSREPPLLLEEKAAPAAEAAPPPPARRKRRIGSLALAGAGYVAIVAVLGYGVLLVLPFASPRLALPEIHVAARAVPETPPASAAPSVPVPPAPPSVAPPQAAEPETATSDTATSETAVPEAAAPEAPPPVAAAAAPAAETPPASAAAPTPAEIELLMRRGQRLLDMGDVVAARLFFEPLVDGGHIPAATALAKTHDPLYLAAIGARGVQPDPARAALLYGRASAAGDAEAADRLHRLLARLPH